MELISVCSAVDALDNLKTKLKAAFKKGIAPKPHVIKAPTLANKRISPLEVELDEQTLQAVTDHPITKLNLKG